jgi:hypothetical protein
MDIDDYDNEDQNPSSQTSSILSSQPPQPPQNSTVSFSQNTSQPVYPFTPSNDSFSLPFSSTPDTNTAVRTRQQIEVEVIQDRGFLSQPRSTPLTNLMNATLATSNHAAVTMNPPATAPSTPLPASTQYIPLGRNHRHLGSSTSEINTGAFYSSSARPVTATNIYNVVDLTAEEIAANANRPKEAYIQKLGHQPSSIPQDQASMLQELGKNAEAEEDKALIELLSQLEEFTPIVRHC